MGLPFLLLHEQQQQNQVLFFLLNMQVFFCFSALSWKPGFIYQVMLEEGWAEMHALHALTPAKS